MKVNLYVIYDKVSMESSNIMQAKNMEIALRLMEKALEGNPYAGDFSLYQIGCFDTESMIGEMHSPLYVSKFDGGEKDVGI